MPFHDAFLNAYTQTKSLLQRQQSLDLEKQIGLANIEHQKLAGKVLLAESARQAHEQQIKDMEAQQAAIASGATFAPAAAPTGDTDESGAPLAQPSAPAAPAPNTVQTPFGAMTAPGPEQISKQTAARAGAVAEATAAGQRAGGVTPQDLTITVPGMQPVTIPAGTPHEAIAAMIQGAAGIKEHQIQASVAPMALLMGGGGGAAQPAAQPSPAGPAPAGGGPAAPTPTPRDQVLAQVPPLLRSNVQALLDGTADPAKISQRSPIGILTMNWVHKIDPTWNEGTYKQRFKLQQSFTSGEESNNIKAVNTAAAHMDTVSRAAEALHNGDLQAFNRLKNSFSTATGSAAVSNYSMAAHVAAQEVAKVVHGAGVVPEGQGQQFDATVSAVNSPEQLDGVLSMAAELMEGRMAAIQNKYEQGMGKPPDQPLFMPKALESIARLKQKASGAPAGSVSVTAPNGKSYNFPNQAQADAFRKRAGIQ